MITRWTRYTDALAVAGILAGDLLLGVLLWPLLLAVLAVVWLPVWLAVTAPSLVALWRDGCDGCDAEEEG